MAISEVSNVNISSSFQGQGSQVKAPVSTDSNARDNSSVASFNQEAASVPAYEITSDSQNKESDGTASNVLKEAVSKINSASDSCEAVFSMHEGTNRVMIKMVDKKTKEVIREFPAEETLDLIAKAWDLAGIMVDERR